LTDTIKDSIILLDIVRKETHGKDSF